MRRHPPIFASGHYQCYPRAVIAKKERPLSFACPIFRNPSVQANNLWSCHWRRDSLRNFLCEGTRKRLHRRMAGTFRQIPLGGLRRNRRSPLLVAPHSINCRFQNSGGPRGGSTAILQRCMGPSKRSVCFGISPSHEALTSSRSSWANGSAVWCDCSRGVFLQETQVYSEANCRLPSCLCPSRFNRATHIDGSHKVFSCWLSTICGLLATSTDNIPG